MAKSSLSDALAALTKPQIQPKVNDKLPLINWYFIVSPNWLIVLPRQEKGWVTPPSKHAFLSDSSSPSPWQEKPE
jgi:hypothetical protein